MKLLDDIIESVTVAKAPIADTLRLCLVLAFKLKNDTLKSWVEKELNGYDYDDVQLPEYRKSAGVAKGLLLGPLNQQMPNQPLAPVILKPEHRHFANEIRLTQPIAAYEDTEAGKTATLPWPADLIVMYQSKFVNGWVLNRAWMEIPGSMMTGLIDTIRTRVLTFALEIQAELPEDTEKAIDAITPAKVEQILQITILGGNNVFGNVQEFNPQTVIAGDARTLMASLKALGVADEDLQALETGLKEDHAYTVDGVPPKIEGNKTKEWITSTAKKLGGGAAKIGGAVAEEALKALVRKYSGLEL